MSAEKKEMTAISIPAALNIPIGEVIKAWREHRGWGVTEFANKAQVPKGYISSLEHTRIEQPTMERLAQLANTLGIEIWDILARRMPSQKHTEIEKKPTMVASSTSQRTPEVIQNKKPIRFGSGLPVVSSSRTKILRDILRQLEETKQMVEELLSSEEMKD